MFGKKAAKKANEEASKLAALASQREAQAAAPQPVQTALDAENLAFLNDTSGKNGPFDITKTAGMAPYAAQFAYDTAADQQAQESQGLGLLTMGAQGSNSNLAGLIRQNRNDRRRQEAGGNLARMFAAKNAEVRGSALPLLQLTQQRQMGLASLAGGRAESAQERAARLAMSSGFLNSPLLGALIQGASAAAGAGLGEGGRWAGH